jgi:glycosyltransferase involved in cell wall biosynthesis
MHQRRKVLVLHNIMAPYRFPLFRALAQQPGIDLTVWFMSRSARNRRWRTYDEDLGFRYEVLPSVEINRGSTDLFTYVLNYSFPLRFATNEFDTLISAGWLDFAAQAGFVSSKVLGRKFILWSESTAYEPSWRRSIAQPMVKLMVRGSNALIAVGTRSMQYLRSLGARDERIFTAYSTVDVEHFREVSVRARLEREQLKSSRGIRQRLVVLFCGQLIERKGLRDLVTAFARLNPSQADAALVLVGYGPLAEVLVAMAAELGIREHVYVLDHVEVEDMPRLYAIGDVFVLPSLEETWGLVVNEAMACGLPLVVSDHVGSSVDLVREGHNGFIVPAGDPTMLAKRLGTLLGEDATREKFGRCSARLVDNFTPERAGAGFCAAGGV